MADLAAHVPRVELWGWPVGHSLSAHMQQAAFSAAGLGWTYVARPVEPSPGVLETVVTEMRSAGPDMRPGANVTVPHKAVAARLMDRMDELADRLQVVNTVAWEGGELWGHNTDVAGTREALAWLGGDLGGARAVVAGAGGAARAALPALLSAGATRVSVVARKSERARTLAPLWQDSGFEVAGWPQPGGWASLLAGAAVLVQATPMGLDGVASPLPAASVPPECGVLDCAYHPRQTFLVREVQARGGRALDGLVMLWAQGMAAFSIWTKLAAPRDVMRQALEGAAGRSLAPGLDG
jgi:shikimate dehydrogenase